MRHPQLVSGLGAALIFAVIGFLAVAAAAQPERWTSTISIAAQNERNGFVTPPFGPLSRLHVFKEDGSSGGDHLFLLGSDCGGRDLLGLVGRGIPPSLLLVLLVVAARSLVGVAAGALMALGVELVSTFAAGMGRWMAGFPYLALAVVLIQALSVSPTRRTLLGFTVGMAAVGWRDVAEVTARVIANVRAQPYTEAARALGSQGLTYFRRHALPHLLPALATELPLQASAVLVLIGELGFLQLYLGGSGISLVYDSTPSGPQAIGCVLAPRPDLAELLSSARDYIVRAEWAPVLVPALTIALLALGFELVGAGLRMSARGRAE